MESKSNLAFYLKYRPQSLSELIGQDHIKRTLLGAFSENRLSHAYLFVGPRGVGKTSTARILAKMVNCEGKGERGKGEVPCNECSNCISITDGSNLDLIEIDAASNRGIEDIRSLREKIKLSPTNSKKKVYIIDEVHMLTTEAFNALLKTLEEPPAHAFFILATTDAQKLPQTILSRVQRLDFKPSSNEELLQALEKIVKAEKIKIDEESLKQLIKKSEGSFRDGIKFLDQVSSLGEEVTKELIQKSFKSTNSEIVFELLELLGKKDTTAALAIIVKQVEEGTDSKDLILSLMDAFRSLVFIKNGLGEQLVKINYSEGNYKSLEKATTNFENKSLILNLDILQKALEKLKTTSIPSLSLELSIVEMCEDIKATPVIAKGESPVDFRVATKQSDAEIAALSPVAHNDESKGSQEMLKQVQHDSSGDIEISSDMQKLKEKWGLVLETIRPFNFSLEALLRSTNITECRDTLVIMEVPYSFHQRILEAPKNRDLLESVISDVLGRSIQISIVLGARSPRKEDIANIEVAADDEIIRVAAEIFSSDSIN